MADMPTTLAPLRLLNVAVRRIWRLLVEMLFRPAARYPADPRAVFILALSVFAGLTAALVGAAPATLESLLPEWAVFFWGALLVAGSITTLVGMVFDTENGVLTEQVGSVMVGVTTVFYSIIAFKVLGFEAFQIVSIVLAWGLSCFLRWLQLQMLLNRDYQERLEQEVVDAVQRAISEESDR